MAATTKKVIPASDVVVGNRTLEAVLIDLADRTRHIDERSVRAEERSARAEELATIALQSIAAVSKDLQAMTAEMRAANERASAQFAALQKARGG